MVAEASFSDEFAARLRDGDEQALAELFSLHRERLRRMVEFRLDRRLQGRVDASDILQEAYIDALQRVHHYTEKLEMPPFVWLRQITTQRLIDVHRRHLDAQKRDARQEVSIHFGDLSAATSASFAAELVGHLASPSQLAIRAELLDQLEGALERMDPIDREVLAMRHFEELTNNEVAQVLGITKSAASNRYVRALGRLKAVLEGVRGFFDEEDAE
jgi:RNA polymerase sigma-70 factor (ECF subfamily)